MDKEELAKIVGSENVLDATETLEEYSTDRSFAPSIKPRCKVTPKSKEEVQGIVKWANETLTPLVPVSSGPPHFRGDTVPSSGGAVIVDLSKMDKILWVNRRNRVAMVEPGVTFSELRAEVEKKGMRVLMPLLPRGTKSVLGSCLEREPLIDPHHNFDISDPLCNVEIVFGTGDFFVTGAGAGPGTIEQQRKSGGAQKNPMGPSQFSPYRIIQGSQGTMGCATWVTVKLELLPKLREPFFVASQKLDNLTELARWLIRQRLADECLILNNINLAAMMAKEWPGEFRSLRDALPSWILFFSLAGYDYFPEERIDIDKELMVEIAQRLGLDPAKVICGFSAHGFLQMLQAPSEEPYWKLRYKGSSHDIFFLTGRDRLQSLIETMYGLASHVGYPVSDLGIYIQPVVQGTSWHCEFNLFFNPDDREEAGRIEKLSLDACQALMAKGAFFSRPYYPWTDLVYRRDAGTTFALKKVKGIFDPNNIMNPGKIF